MFHVALWLATFPGVRRGYETSDGLLLPPPAGEPDNTGAGRTTAPTPIYTEHWILEESHREVAPWHCNTMEDKIGRNADQSECLEAVREAAQREGLTVTGPLRIVNEGLPVQFVPPGCSYSLHDGEALFNTNITGGATPKGVSTYRLCCLAPADAVPGSVPWSELRSSVKTAAQR